MSRPPKMVIGRPLVEDAAELQRLIDNTIARRLSAVRIDDQADGDVRFWAVDTSESPILERLLDFGQSEFRKTTGAEPLFSFVMINAIDPKRSPNGSGGGWHRDSSRRQYKAFVYLTDVSRPEQGAFCFVPGSNSRWFWAVSMAYRSFTGANRYSDRAIGALTRIGFRLRPVLMPAGTPFFVNTSLIHRGLPISEGRRVMATLYISEDLERMSADFKEFYAAHLQRIAAAAQPNVVTAR